MGNKYTSGAVSIFAVIFATLLLTVLTVGFISLMIVAQQRAINNDLSQSAYDAALAGVEDAKRVVRACADSSTSPACEELEKPADCKVVARAGINGSSADSETRIVSGLDVGDEFDQAYTCVNIDMNSPDYLAQLTGDTEIVPLRAEADVNKVVVEWFTQGDNGNSPTVTRPTTDSDRLPSLGDWDVDAPPLLRVQLITPGTEFTALSLNETAKSSTFFFRPQSISSDTTPTGHPVSINDSAPARATGGDDAYSNSLTPIACSQYAFGGYACRVELNLQGSRLISRAASQNALLRLDAIYKSTGVRVAMYNDSGEVRYDGVQPVVDATGRANDLFRRVESRLRLGSDFSYPSYVVDLENALCKDFAVNDTGATGSCNP